MPINPLQVNILNQKSIKYDRPTKYHYLSLTYFKYAQNTYIRLQLDKII